MMKYIGIIILIFNGLNSMGQSTEEDIVVMSFVKKDTVLLRWAPKSPELLLEGLKYGYKIERIEGENSNFDVNPSLKVHEILPFSQRKGEIMDSGDTSAMQITAFIESFIDNSGRDENATKMTYAVMMLAAGPDKRIAEILGLYFTDTEIENKKYLYRISTLKGTKGLTKVDGGQFSKHQEFSELNGVSRPKLTEAYLTWEAQNLTKGYSGFWIERSVDSVKFKILNETPYYFMKSQYEPDKVNADFVDTNVVEGGTYYYRITGINHFAERGNSSNTVKVYIQHVLKGECRIDTIYADKHERVIKGRFVDWAENNQLKEFILYRSDSLQSGYKILTKTNNKDGSFEFTATSALLTGDRHYYRVDAVNIDNDTVRSFPYYFFTLDQEPPHTPVGLEGTVNDSGIVSLSWQPNADNDMRGYRVFRANSLNEEFIEVTKHFATAGKFHDTLRLDNLTSQVYYRIAAVDMNYNNSGFTEPVKLMKPDTIAPVPCVFTAYRSKREGMYLKWANSSSEDVAVNYLLRTGKTTDTLLIWQAGNDTIVDSTAVSGQSYRYKVLTIDNSGNATLSNELQARHETGLRPGAGNLNATVDREQKTINLNWEKPDAEIYSIQIYRAKNDGNYRLVETIRENTDTYEDKDLYINNTYRYKIKIVYQSGHSSPLSDEVEVVY